VSSRAFSDERPDLVEELGRRLEKGIEDVRAYLASPEGQELRRRIAQVAVIAAPLLFRMRFFRASPIGRVLGLVGGAALLVKLAEALRDWEPAVAIELD
jgi:hypothetical protein